MTVPRALAYKPILAGPQNAVRGYVVLHNQESKHVDIALQEMPNDAIAWYLCLTLMDDAIRREHESPEPGPSAGWYSWNFRLQLLATAIATSKSGLDAVLAGYYSQAYALQRHLLETWRLLAFSRTHPAEVHRWYPNIDGSKNHPPNESKVMSSLYKLAKKNHDSTLVTNLDAVDNLIKQCNDGAHPSYLVVAQSRTENTGHSQMASGYQKDLAATTMNNGIAATMLVLSEAIHLIPLEPEWKVQYGELLRQRGTKRVGQP
jgi:hypothetical protein